MELTSSPQSTTRRLPRHLAVVVAIVAGITLLGGGIAVAQNGGPGGRGRDHRPHGLAGTITSIAAPTFTVDRRNDEAATVTTTSDTTYSKTSDATVADAIVGSYVIVHGKRAEDGSATVAARRIHIVPASTDNEGRRPKGGVVLTNDGSTLTVQKSDDSVVTVTTDENTKVRKTTKASVDDLATGQFVRTAGAWEDGGLTARHVAINLSTRPTKTPPADDTTTTTVASGTPTAITEPADDDTPTTAATSPEDRRVGGQITAINGATFTIENPRRTITVLTNNDTTYRVRHDDGTVTDGSFADLAIGDKIMVVGAKQDDGTVVADAVVSCDCTEDRGEDRREDRREDRQEDRQDDRREDRGGESGDDSGGRRGGR